MAKTASFNPRTLVEDQQALTQTSDAMTANALKHQTFLHRQRLGAARVRLARAVERGDTPDEIAMLETKVLTREARLTQAEAQFAAADIVSPTPNSDVAQVLGQVTGDAGEAPYTAALVATNGELIASVAVGDNGAFLLDRAGAIRDARLQISDAAQAILFRDAEAFDVEPGQIATRTVALNDPGKPAAPAPTVLTMPTVVGQTEEAACAILFRLGVREIDVTRQASEGPAGLVLLQEPQPGTVLEPEGGAKLTVSQSGDDPGPEPEAVEMPDIIGLTLDEAQATTEARGIKLAQTSRPDAAPAGTIVAQSPPAGQVLTPPLQATAVISEGQVETSVVPNVTGRTERQATAALQRAGFTVVRETVRQSGEANIVVRQQPDAGAQAVPGAAVRIVVNLGLREVPAEVLVPRLTGRSADEARAIGEEAGFVIRQSTVRSDGPSGIVIQQRPAAGTRMTLPATIAVTVNQGAEVERPVRGNFTRELTAAMRQDQRLEGLGLNNRALGQVMTRLELTDKAAVERVIAMDNAELAEKAGFRNLAQARTMRSILRGAMARME